MQRMCEIGVLALMPRGLGEEGGEESVLDTSCDPSEACEESQPCEKAAALFCAPIAIDAGGGLSVQLRNLIG